MSSPVVVLESGRLAAHYWRDLWRYRELLMFLAWRDVTVHYKQTVVGVAWALLRPLATTIVFVVVFSKFAKMPSGGVPYPLLVLAGMMPWQLFASGLSESSNSLINNSNLISKVYFPRLIMPFSAVAVSLVDLLATSPVLIGLMIYYHQPVTLRVLVLPLFVLIASAGALGAGFWLSAMNVRYRDVRYVIPFVIQFGLYLTPVGFSSAVVPERFRFIYALNPMVGVIDGVRWALLGTDTLHPVTLAASVVMIAVLMSSGAWYFRRTERTFADVI